MSSLSAIQSCSLGRLVSLSLDLKIAGEMKFTMARTELNATTEYLKLASSREHEINNTLLVMDAGLLLGRVIETRNRIETSTRPHSQCMHKCITPLSPSGHRLVIIVVVFVLDSVGPRAKGGREDQLQHHTNKVSKQKSSKRRRLLPSSGFLKVPSTSSDNFSYRNWSRVQRWKGGKIRERYSSTRRERRGRVYRSEMHC